MPDYTQQLLEKLEEAPEELTNKISALYMANHRASLRNRIIEKINTAGYGQLRRWILGFDFAGLVPIAPEHIRNDPYYVGLAIGRRIAIYNELSDDLQRNPIVVATALERDASLDLEDFEATDFDVSEDRAIVLAAVRVRGLLLQDASDQLQRDREVVMAAVQNDGRALRYASDELIGDREVVMAAVRSNGRALRYASDELQIDDGILEVIGTRN
jgi:hypothetical protein